MNVPKSKRVRASMVIFGMIASVCFWLLMQHGSGVSGIAQDERTGQIAANFGRVKPDTVVDQKIQIVNDSSGTWTLSGLVGSCGCLELGFNPNIVPAGEKAFVSVHFRTPSSKGKIQHSIMVHFKEATASPVEIDVSAVVRGDLSVMPERIDLGAVQRGAKISTKVNLLDRCGSVVDWKSSSADHSWTTVADASSSKILDSADSATADLVTMEVLFDVPSDFSGSVFDGIIRVPLKTGVKEAFVEIPYAGMVVEKAKADPPSIFFGYVELNSVNQKCVSLVARNGDPIVGSLDLKTEGVGASHVRFLVEENPSANAKQCVINVEVAPTEPGEIFATVVVSSGAEVLCKIPVIAYVER